MKLPGIMLYFDTWEAVQGLTDSDKGKLMTAMMEYARLNRDPGFKGRLALAWGFIRPKIDRDRMEYENAVRRRQYGVYCREQKKKKLLCLPFEDWSLMTHDDSSGTCMGLDESYPTTTTNTTTKPKSTTTTEPATEPATEPTTEPTKENKNKNNQNNNTSAAPEIPACAGSAAAAATTEKKLKIMNGELGKGKVVLSDAQIDVLLNRLGIEMFDYYVEKLAGWIQSNGATVKSHYATILKWWMEDSIC